MKVGRRLDQFRIEAVKRTSNVITAERQLRNLLGLPQSDGRRIVPVTGPVEVNVEPDWEVCLSAMRTKQPDVLRARERRAEKSDLDIVAKAFLPDLAGNRTIVEQVTHEATHAMARPFREIADNSKQYQTAKKRRMASEEMLAAQRAYYKEGRITIDKCLDAVSQYAQAVAVESQLKATHNIALVSLEEAKGTLLERDKITLVECPSGGAQAGEVEASARKLVFKMPAPAERTPSPEIHDAPAPRPEPKPTPPTPAPRARPSRTRGGRPRSRRRSKSAPCRSKSEARSPSPRSRPDDRAEFGGGDRNAKNPSGCHGFRTRTPCRAKPRSHGVRVRNPWHPRFRAAHFQRSSKPQRVNGPGGRRDSRAGGSSLDRRPSGDFPNSHPEAAKP